MFDGLDFLEVADVINSQKSSFQASYGLLGNAMIGWLEECDSLKIDMEPKGHRARSTKGHSFRF